MNFKDIGSDRDAGSSLKEAFDPSFPEGDFRLNMLSVHDKIILRHLLSIAEKIVLRSGKVNFNNHPDGKYEMKHFF
jgi:hypothetical protein